MGKSGFLASVHTFPTYHDKYSVLYVGYAEKGGDAGASGGSSCWAPITSASHGCFLFFFLDQPILSKVIASSLSTSIHIPILPST